MSRTRSVTTPTVIQGPWHWYGRKKDGSLLGDTVTSYSHTKSRVMVDNVTPGFFDKLAKGQFLPVNACTITNLESRNISVHTGSTVKVPYPTTVGPVANGDGSLYYIGTNPTLPAYATLTSDLDYAVIKALSSAKQPDWDVLTFAAEFPKTVTLLMSTARKLNRWGTKAAKRALRRETRRAKRKKVKYDPKKAFQDFLGLWLQMRYGWRPLVYDMVSMLKALNHKRQSSIERKSARHSVVIDQYSAAVTIDDGSNRWTGVRHRKGTCKIRAVVFHDSNIGPIGLNPLITGWELTRFSFVVDWFINIGDWLTAISPRSGYNQLGISISTVVDYTETYTQVHAPPSNGSWSGTLSPLVNESIVNEYTRAPYSGFPLPSIQVNLNPLKIVDLIALVLQGQRDVAKILKL